MKNTNSFRHHRWRQQYRKLQQRLEIAMQQGKLADWSAQKIKQVWAKLHKLSQRLKRDLKPGILAGFISTGLIVKKEAQAAVLPEENPFAPDAEFRKMPTVYRERAYLHYEQAKLDPTGNLDWRPFKTNAIPAYQLNIELPRIKRESTTIQRTVDALQLPMQAIQMDGFSDFGANYGIYGGSLDYQLSNPSDPSDPPAAPSQPDLIATSDTGNPTNNITEVAQPILTGSAQQGTLITLESNLDGVVATAVSVDANGQWPVQLKQPLTKGKHQIIAKAINEKGISPASAPLTVITGGFTETGTVVHNTNTGFDFVFGSDSLNNKVLTGTADDARFFFDKSKAAWRAGLVTGDEWDDANIGTNSTVAGGRNNQASGSNATVAGGRNNQASGSNATVGGGLNNKASITSATVGGGERNEATASYATVGGGERNKATASYATVGGGGRNIATASHATVGGGYENKATASYATVGGGAYNEANGDRSTIPGGLRLVAKSFGETVIGVDNTAYTPTSTTSFNLTDRLFVIGNGSSSINKSNALVMLKNGNTQLNGVLSLSNGTDTLVLPNTKGTNGQILTSDGAGNATWANASGGAGAFSTTSNVTSNSPGTLGTDDFVFGSSQLEDSGNTSEDARFFFDKSKAAWRVGKVTGDQWDEFRIGNYSSIAGGKDNIAGGKYTGIIAGSQNEIGNFFASHYSVTDNSIIGGGSQNQIGYAGMGIGTATAKNSFIGGGQKNEIIGSYSIIGGGFENKTSADNTTISGGRKNKATLIYATVGAGVIGSKFRKTYQGVPLVLRGRQNHKS